MLLRMCFPCVPSDRGQPLVKAGLWPAAVACRAALNVVTTRHRLFACHISVNAVPARNRCPSPPSRVGHSKHYSYTMVHVNGDCATGLHYNLVSVVITTGYNRVAVCNWKTFPEESSCRGSAWICAHGTATTATPHCIQARMHRVFSETKPNLAPLPSCPPFAGLCLSFSRAKQSIFLPSVKQRFPVSSRIHTLGLDITSK